MKYFFLFLLSLTSWCVCAQESNQTIVTSDIDNFWIAYDKISATNDSAKQYEYINEYIAKGSSGLKAMMEVRRYTPQSYIDAINSYPAFWESIRPNTLKAKGFAIDIEKGVSKLKDLYPEMKPANVYFTVGALLSNGTTQGNSVLIGSELALADENTVSSEFQDRLSHLPYFFQSNPIQDIVFLNVHEFVHTQQKTTIGNTLLARCVLEGVAEFLAAKALEKASPTPAISFGQKQYKRIRDAFSKEMFSPIAQWNWLNNDFNNEFQMRDLGYYTGYAICESYYNKTADKKAAIKEMIELDYNNEDALAAFVDKSGYFEKPVKQYRDEFEKSRPYVVGIKPFKNGDKNVKPGNTEIIIEFSQELDTSHRNFDYGPLGESNVLLINRVNGFSADGKSISVMADLQPGRHYQMTVGPGFRTADGTPLIPYLIDIITAEK